MRVSNGGAPKISTEASRLVGELIDQSGKILAPFAKQAFVLRSFVVVYGSPNDPSSLRAHMLRLDWPGRRPLRITIDNRPSDTAAFLAELYRRVTADNHEKSCGYLLVMSAEMLAAAKRLGKAGAEFQAAAVVMPPRSMRRSYDPNLSLRRNLFDAGLVSIGSVPLRQETLNMFLASAEIRSPMHLDKGSRGMVTMSSLGTNGRFGNQLFQYAFMKLYGLRHGIRIGLPDWPGRSLFHLSDPSSNGTSLTPLAFQGFDDKDLTLWEVDEPPLQVDFWGYFQEIPACWRPHRHLLSSLFTIPVPQSRILDTWGAKVTNDGRRALVALHVRRTDYVTETNPHFRVVPEAWYVDWLRDIWPSLPDPILYVATDDPGQVLPHFKEFSPLSTRDLPQTKLPDHVLDFEAMRRADCLAICNSSFSRMAAILADTKQRCFIPSFAEARFMPYDAWDGELFWRRFEKPSPAAVTERSARQVEFQPATKLFHATKGVGVYFDVTDLLSHLGHHPTVSGIQRVQCELLSNLGGEVLGSDINFTIFAGGQLAIVSKPALLGIIESIRTQSAASRSLQRQIGAVLRLTVPADPQDGDLFLATGAFWSIQGIGRLVVMLKDLGVRTGAFVHDILPITRPEYFPANTGKVLVQPVIDVLALADFAITSTHYNRRAISDHRARKQLASIPIDVAPLGHELTKALDIPGDTDPIIAAILKSRFVLCVGTVEVRKNPLYLFNIWRMMIDAGRQDIPTLVFAGRKGWMADDFLAQLEATENLGARVVLLHELSDETLHLLYRNCLLTMFPSFDEGWGLPVGESLSHDKICLASTTGGVPEVGGAFSDYIDPYDVRSGYDRLVHYLDNPDTRRSRELEIAEGFVPRRWSEHAREIVRSVLARIDVPVVAPRQAAVALPANEFLPIGKHIQGSSPRAARGYLSAESACVSGWGALDAAGIVAADTHATIRFRIDRARTRVTLILRLHAAGSRQCRLSIRSNSGAARRVAIKPGAELMATLACESDENGLISVWLERGDDKGSNPSTRPALWLKGFLYILPTSLLYQPSVSGEPDARSFLEAARPPACGRAVETLEEFLAVPDGRWQSASTVTAYRREPIMLDGQDRNLFMTRYRNMGSARLGAVSDDISFNRVSSPYLVVSRFAEGVVIDRTGVAKDHGYLVANEEHLPWLTKRNGTHWIDRQVLANAKHMTGTYLMFYNGNLHNYYHWVAEGLLALDIMTQTLGDRLDLRIVLPKTMDIAAVFDHRGSLASLGFDRLPIVEAPPPMLRVDEAIWLDGREFPESVPAADVRRFQRRVFSLCADRRPSQRKRLLVKRLGTARAIGNFDEVEAFLKPLGFETVWLEGKTIEEQVLLFQQAEFIVAAHGAGLTNILFCQPGTKVIEFMPTVEMRPFFWAISEKLGLRHAMLFCHGVEGIGFQASIHVDIDRLRRIYELTEIEP